MDMFRERRKEQRLRYQWPIWFAENFNEVLGQGQMADISSSGAAFTCRTDEDCPYPGQRITARFSVPKFGPGDSFDMASFTRNANVCRVDNVSSFLRRIAVRFADPLPFRPGEQTATETQTQQKLSAVTI